MRIAIIIKIIICNTVCARDPPCATNCMLLKMSAINLEYRRGKKRLRYEEQWVKKKRKVDKDRGTAYTTYSGDQKPEKELVSLTCHCSYKCSKKISDEERQRIFQKFYDLGNHDAQNKYLFGLISVADVKRRTVSTGRPRTRTIVYQIRMKDGGLKQVCKNSFCNIHAIGKKRVERLVEKCLTVY